MTTLNNLNETIIEHYDGVDNTNKKTEISISTSEAIDDYYKNKEEKKEFKDFNIENSLEDSKEKDIHLREKIKNKEYGEIERLSIALHMNYANDTSLDGREERVNELKRVMNLCNKYKTKYGEDISYLV